MSYDDTTNTYSGKPVLSSDHMIEASCVNQVSGNNVDALKQLSTHKLMMDANSECPYCGVRALSITRDIETDEVIKVITTTARPTPRKRLKSLTQRRLEQHEQNHKQ